MLRLASILQPDSIVDGEGIRTVIWTQGCIHNCPGCHNPATHNLKGGFTISVDEICKQLKNIPSQDGITFSGGDPMLQPEPCTKISKYAKKIGLNVWCYTGFTYEELINMSKTNKKVLNFLKEIDVLIDGRFILEQKSLNLKFKGSRNQRIIDVKESLKQNKVILVSEYINEIDHSNLYKKDKYMYL